MANVYESGDFAVAAAISSPRFSNPIPRTNSPYLLQQDFMQKNASWATTALNTAHPTFTDFLLCEESDRIPLDGGLVTWTRTYAKVPPSHSEPTTMNYLFPGYLFGNSAMGNDEARYPQSLPVPAYILHDYFLIGTGGTYPNLYDVPLLVSQAYTGAGGAAFPTRILGALSIPTKDQYIESIIGHLINVEGASLEFWHGNVVLRKTPQVIAQ